MAWRVSVRPGTIYKKKKTVTFSCDPGQIVDEAVRGFITLSLCMLPTSCMLQLLEF